MPGTLHVYIHAPSTGPEMTAQVEIPLFFSWVYFSHSDPPENVTLIPTGSDRLQLSWGLPSQNTSEEFETTLFIVIFEGNEYHVNPSSSLVMELDSLTPFTTYNCCVATNTTSGPSRLGCATQTTLEAGNQLFGRVM